MFRSVAKRLALVSMLAAATPVLALTGYVDAPSNTTSALRVDASNAGATIRDLPDGLPVEVIETDDSGFWYRVRTARDETGWIARRHLRVEGRPDYIERSTAPRPENDSAALTYFVDAPVAGGLNLRAGPGTEHAVLREMPHGTEVAVFGATADRSWLRLRDTSGTIGWASGRYLSQSSPARALDRTPRDLTQRPDPVEAETHDLPSSRYYVDSPVTGGLNLRRGPGTGHAVLHEMPHGSPVTVLASNADGTWLQLRDVTGRTGWASARYLDPRRTARADSGQLDRIRPDGPITARPADAPSQGTRFVNAPSAGALNLRSGPGTGFDVVDTMAQGSRVEIIGGSNPWRLVRHESGEIGYAHDGYLARSRPVAERRQAPRTERRVIRVTPQDLPRMLAACTFSQRPVDECMARQLRQLR